MAPLADDGAARNTWFALLTQVSTAVFTTVLTLVVVRVLKPDAYGVFALAVGLGGLLMLPADVGVSNSAARFVAERRGRPADAAAIVADALTIKLVTSIGLAAMLMALAGPIAGAYGEPDMAWPLRGIAIAVVGQSLMMLYMATFAAARRVRMNLRLVVSESAVEATASVSLVLLGAGATGAAFGRAIGYVTGGIVGLFLLRRLFGRRATAISRRGGERRRRLAGYAGALFVIDASFALFSQIDVLLIGAILGTASVGLYSAPLRLVALFGYPGNALASGIAPRLAGGLTSDPADRAAFLQGLRWLIVVQAAIMPPLLAWPEPIVGLLFGDDYAGSAPVMRALAPFIFLNGLAALLSIAVNYLGYARRRIPIVLFALVLKVSLDVAFLSRYGIVVAALSSVAAYLVYVPAHFWICRQTLGLPIAPLLATLGRALLASAAATGLLLAFGSEDLELWVIPAGAAAAAAGFLAVLVASREVGRAEVDAARALSARVRSRAAREGGPA